MEEQLSLLHEHYKPLSHDMGGEKSLSVYDRMRNNVMHSHSMAWSSLPLLEFIEGLLKSSVNLPVVS